MTKPNIIIIYADDLGFGDVGCYGATALPTPNLDRLAATGLRFTQGYATAATCTPSRYSLLTGAYPWRNPKAAILTGDAAMIIGDHEPTLPGILRTAGYRTGIVGKWHLGLGRGHIDWNGAIAKTPNDVGFDSSHIMAATNDRVPCVYLQDRRVVGLDPSDPIEVTYDMAKPFPGEKTGKDHPEFLTMHHSHGHNGTIVNGVGRIGHMRGGGTALWSDIDMGDHFLEEAKRFIAGAGDRPYFLYYALHQPHVPRIPHPRFRGATTLGPRGDVIVELDWCVGQLLDELERLGQREHTLIIFSSDNGPVVDDGYHDGAVECLGTHRPAGPLRGGKYSLFDGGTRVPFLVSWPGTIVPGSTSEALVCQVDLLASCAALAGAALPERAGPDSEDLVEAFLGRSAQGRKELVVEGIGAKTVLRQGSLAYIPPHPGPALNVHTNTELGNSRTPQLYDLSADIGQIHNIAEERPDDVARLHTRLDTLRASPRSRAGSQAAS